MSKKKWTISGIVVGVLLFAFTILKSALKSIIDPIQNALTFPFEKLILIAPDSTTSEFLQWLFIFMLVFIYLGFVFGVWAVIRSFKRKENEHPFSLCDEELAVVLDSIDQQKDELVVKAEMLSFMKEFERGVSNIFDAGDQYHKCLWIVPKDDGITMMTSSGENQFTKEESDWVKWALAMPKSRFYVDDIRQFSDSNGLVEEMVWVQNLGEFKLGFVIFSYKKGMVNKDSHNSFITATSYLMLLGRVDKFTDEMVKLT